MRQSNFIDGLNQIAVFTGELIDERTYAIRGKKEAIIIDPHMEEKLILYLQGAETVSVFLTHEHYDHISGVNLLKEHFHCVVYASDVCSDIVADLHNGTRYFPILLIGNIEKYHWAKKSLDLPYVCNVDVLVKNKMQLCLAGHELVLWKSPGHSPGGMSILVDGKYLFSGDNLLGNGMELKSLGADSNIYKNTISIYCEFSGNKTIVFPGHGEIDFLDEYLKKVKENYKWG